MAGVEIRNLTRHDALYSERAGRRVFPAIAKHVLPAWDISLVFVDPARARALNKKLRGKNYAPNVLSYTVGRYSGEVMICLSVAFRQAPSYNLSPASFLLLLFIHALLHLEGGAHGVTMEKRELKLLARFLPAGGPGATKVPRALSPSHETTHCNRN